MKYILLATVAAIGLAAVGAQAAEEYPTPITRPIYSSVPVQDVAGGGPWSKSMVVTGNGGYTMQGTAQGMPGVPEAVPATPTYVQQGQGTGSRG